MIINKDNAPPLEKMNPSVFSFERALDPWHEDAFPTEHKELGCKGSRKEGWLCLDYWGNPIGFIADGEYASFGEESQILVKFG